MGADNNQGKGLFYLFLVIGAFVFTFGLVASTAYFFPISDQSFPDSPPNNRLECTHGEQAYSKNNFVFIIGVVLPIFVLSFISWCYRSYSASENAVAKRIAEKTAQGWVVEELRNPDPDATAIVFSERETPTFTDGRQYLFQNVPSGQVDQFGQPILVRVPTVRTEVVQSTSKVSLGFLIFWLLVMIAIVIIVAVMAITQEDLRKCHRNEHRLDWRHSIFLAAVLFWGMLGIGACFGHERARVLEWVKNPDAQQTSFAYGTQSVHTVGYGTGTAASVNANGQNVGLTKHASSIWVPLRPIIQTTVTTTGPAPVLKPQVQVAATDTNPNAIPAQQIPGPQVAVIPTTNASTPP